MSGGFSFKEPRVFGQGKSGAERTNSKFSVGGLFGAPAASSATGPAFNLFSNAATTTADVVSKTTASTASKTESIFDAENAFAAPLTVETTVMPKSPTMVIKKKGRGFADLTAEADGETSSRHRLSKKVSPNDVAKRFGRGGRAAIAAIQKRRLSSQSTSSAVLSSTSTNTGVAASSVRQKRSSQVLQQARRQQRPARTSPVALTKKPPSKATREKLISTTIDADVFGKNKLADDKAALIPAELTHREVVARLQELIGRHAETAMERYQLLEERDKILRRGRAKVSDVERAAALWGDCPDMCPERERYQRDVQKRISSYEMTSSGSVDHRLAVKDYSRSSADQEEPLPHELRSGDLLELTMDYLLSAVFDRPPTETGALTAWYNFLWDRTRSIRKDLTQQQLVNPSAVSLMEKCTRFHIFVAHHLAPLSITEFDQRMNTENLTKCLQSLRHFYEDLAKRGVACPNESEFRAYDVLLNLKDPNVVRQVMNYGEGLMRQTPNVRLAVKLFTAAQNNNYVQFFRLIKEKATYLQACLAYRHFDMIRLNALKTIAKVHFTSDLYPVEELTQQLGFNDEFETVEFFSAYGLLPSSDSRDIIINRQSFGDPDPPLPSRRSETLVGAKLIERSLGQLLNGGPLRQVELPIPVMSFDDNGNYVNDPVIHHYLNLTEAEVNVNAAVTQQARVFVQPIVETKEMLSYYDSVCNDAMQSLVAESAHTAYLNSVAERIFEDMAEEATDTVCEDEYADARDHALLIELENERTRLTDSIESATIICANRLIDTYCDSVVRERVTREIIAARYECRKGAAQRLCTALCGSLFDAVTADVVAATAVAVHRAHVQEPLERLAVVRRRLDNLWLRQFADHWRSVTRLRRHGRSCLAGFPTAPSTSDTTTVLMRPLQCSSPPTTSRSQLEHSFYRHYGAGDLSDYAETYVGADAAERLRRLIEQQQRNLKRKYLRQWLTTVKLRKQKRTLYEAFPLLAPFSDDEGISCEKRRRLTDQCASPSNALYTDAWLSAVYRCSWKNDENKDTSSVSIKTLNEPTNWQTDTAEKSFLYEHAGLDDIEGDTAATLSRVDRQQMQTAQRLEAVEPIASSADVLLEERALRSLKVVKQQLNERRQSLCQDMARFDAFLSGTADSASS